jgi:hypothetical protein
MRAPWQKALLSREQGSDQTFQLGCLTPALGRAKPSFSDEINHAEWPNMKTRIFRERMGVAY